MAIDDSKTKKGNSGFLPEIAKNSLSNIFDVESKKVLFNDVRTTYSRLVSPLEGRKETFDEAVQRQGLTNEDLLVVTGQLRFKSRLLYLSSILVILLGFYYAMNGSALAVLSSFCISIMFICYAVPNAMRFWQIKNKSLCSFKVWMRNPENWFV